ncbi:copper-transporting ATPase HMA4-like isoform X2 [Malus domestica]|uniref:copper-transporting ATPase HMA4-like isoform X2 n=1 Tax=Malus domestica TaxID=3750 RepID=UPI003974B384
MLRSSPITQWRSSVLCLLSQRWVLRLTSMFQNMIIWLERVLVSIDGKIAGSFAVTDPVKPEAARVISYLHSMNITSIMVTGDDWATAAASAMEVGMDKVYTETDPLGKADRIKELQ